jgi:hypothetical protein
MAVQPPTPDRGRGDGSDESDDPRHHGNDRGDRRDERADHDRDLCRRRYDRANTPLMIHALEHRKFELK